MTGPTANGSGGIVAGKVAEPPSKIDPEVFAKMGARMDRHRETVNLKDHHQTALKFAGTFLRSLDILVYWRRSWYGYNGRSFDAVPRESVEDSVRIWLNDKCLDDKGNRPLPSVQTIANIVAALRSISSVSPVDAPPCFLANAPADRDPKVLLPLRNCVLDLNTLETYAHFPSLFALYHLPYDYRPDAPEPATWLRFLDETFAHEPEAIRLIQEFVGYCLTARRDLQFGLFVKGPPQTGKGVLARTIIGLLGEDRLAKSIVSSNLGDTFGPAMAIGKNLLAIPDARFSWRDRSVALEFILNLIGGDAVPVRRPFQDFERSAIGAKLLICSNKYPAFSESSAAVSRRLLLIETEKRVERADPTLEGRIAKEFPGILNWAIKGLQRLKAQGYYSQYEAIEERRQELRRGDSADVQFHDDCLEYREGAKLTPRALRAAYQIFCEDMGVRPKGMHNLPGRMRDVSGHRFPATSSLFRNGSFVTRAFDSVTLTEEMRSRVVNREPSAITQCENG